jgi:CRP/FNR family transcriptional regulator, cyclic AMP receptor protein
MTAIQNNSTDQRMGRMDAAFHDKANLTNDRLIIDHPVFHAGSDFYPVALEAREALARLSKIRVYRANEFVYLQDDDADFLHFVRSGHIRMSCLMDDGSAVLFGFLGPGETFGELGVLEGGVHVDMATAVGSASVASVSASAFHNLAQRYPALEIALGRTVARRYRAYIEISRSLRLKTLSARLAQAILRLADGLGTVYVYKGKKVPGIGAFVTQADLGLMARGARGNVNRRMKSWERDGLIALQDRCLLILDRDGLNNMCVDDDL